jgi:Ca2+-binding EF-hand superfamily protein
MMPNMHRSKRSLSSGKTASADFFPKLPNLLSNKTFVAFDDSKEVQRGNGRNWHHKRDTHPRFETSDYHHKPERKPDGYKAMASGTKSKDVRKPHQPGFTWHTTKTHTVDKHVASKNRNDAVNLMQPSQDAHGNNDAANLMQLPEDSKEKSLPEDTTEDTTKYHFESTASECKDEDTVCSEDAHGCVAAEAADFKIEETVDCSDANAVKICTHELLEIFEWPDCTSQQSPTRQVNRFGDIVYVQKKEKHTHSLCMKDVAVRSREVSRPASAMSQNSRPASAMSQKSIQPDLPNQAVADNMPTVQPSVMDEKEVDTIDAVLSPARLKRRKSRAVSRDFARGQTIGLKGQMNTTCLSEEKLQGLESTFTKYDEDHNGRLSVLEFGKFLQDQGMEVDVSEVKKAVAMVAPEGQGGIDLDSFTQLVAHGLQAQALREEQTCGYSQEEADVLRAVFDGYDVNHSGVLEASEIGTLLQDMGQAPKSLAEQEEFRNVLQKIVGGKPRPLRFREFLELAKILETTTIGSGGHDAHEHRLDHRRSSDRLEIARKVGLTMSDLAWLQGIFENESKNGSTLSSSDLYELLKARLRLHAAEGEREQRVHFAIEKFAGTVGSVDFEDFLLVIGDLVDAKLATVSALLGREVGEERSTNSFLSHMKALIE